MADGELAASLAVVTVGTTIYTSFLPPFPRVLAAPFTPQTATAVRTSECFAAAATLGVGTTLTFITKGKMPLAVAVTTVLAMTVVYEYSLRRSHVGL